MAFATYVFLFNYCGRYEKPATERNLPAGTTPLWGGFWLTQAAKKAVAKGTTIKSFLAGNQYAVEAVWTPASLALSAVAAAVVLLATLVSVTAAIATASTSAQVALTGKPARQVLSSSEVPGLPNQ